MAKPIERVAPS